MKKFLLYICLILLGVVIADKLFSLAVDAITHKHYVAPLAHTEGACEDIAIIGSSRASHHYDPQIIADSLGMTAYNYGIEGLNIYADHVLLSMLLDKAAKKPQMVILDLSESDICDVPGWNTEHISMLFPYAGEPAVDSVLADVLDPREYAMVRVSALYRHNSRLIDYLKDHTPKGNNGMTALEGVWSGLPREEMQQSYQVSPSKLAYLEKFVSLCQDNGIRLVLATSPNYKRLPPKQQWVEETRRIAKAHSVEYLYHEQDEDFLHHPEWFNEPYHLNATGAAIYTKRIIPSLPSPE